MKNERIFNLLGIYCISVDSNDGDSRFLYVKIRKTAQLNKNLML